MRGEFVNLHNTGTCSTTEVFEFYGVLRNIYIVTKLKLGKSAGIDRISGEIIKNIG